MAGTKIQAMWGPVRFPSTNDLESIDSISELTFRYLHGEIKDWTEYMRLMGEAKNRVESRLDNSFASDKTRKDSYTKMANTRLYNKTPLEMFTAVEIVIHLAHEDNPKVAFRMYLERAFTGLWALHQTVGQFIVPTDDATGNIAGFCNLFGAGFYTKKTASDGTLSFTPTLRREFVAKREFQSLTTSPLFDFIKILFPSASEMPRMDSAGLQAKLDKIQQHCDAVSSLDPFNATALFKNTSPGSTNMTLDMSAMTQFAFSNENAMDVMAGLTTMIHLGTHEVQLADWEQNEIIEADLYMIPVITEWFNRARICMRS